MQKAQIHIYTDGSALGNPGPGGYGIIIELVGQNYYKEYAQGYAFTTNNRNGTLRGNCSPGKNSKNNL